LLRPTIPASCAAEVVTIHDMSQPPKRKHFSMIRDFQFSDALTLANGCCGVAAMFQAMRYLQLQERLHLYVAAGLVPIAIIFDVLDGRVARWRSRASPLGRELDSLADVISFGMAPAAIAFSIGLDTLLDQAILAVFVLCGLSRLARYNITADALSDDSGKVHFYEGTPIPTSVIPLFLLLGAYELGLLLPVTVAGQRLHLATLLFLVSGGLMISKTLRIPKL
jgi:CDP-diacylglycerol--serine O-phosphatidyltransferase